MVFFVYSQIFATHLFHIRNVFFVYSQISKFYQMKFPKKEFHYIKKSIIITIIRGIKPKDLKKVVYKILGFCK